MNKPPNSRNVQKSRQVKAEAAAIAAAEAYRNKASLLEDEDAYPQSNRDTDYPTEERPSNYLDGVTNDCRKIVAITDQLRWMLKNSNDVRIGFDSVDDELADECHHEHNVGGQLGEIFVLMSDIKGILAALRYEVERAGQ